MNALPKAIWGVLGLAVLVLMALVWLHLHDSEIRKTAELTIVIDAKDDTIRTLSADIVELGKSIKAADEAWAAAKGSVVHVAYVPPALRDSLLALNHLLDSLASQGGSVVPIAVARRFQTQLNACTRARDDAAAQAMVEESKCDQALHLRDRQIADLTRLKALAEDKLVATRTLAGLAHPRFTPYVQANYSPIRGSYDGEAGATLRLFAQLHLTGAVRVGELSTDSLFRPDSLPRVIHHRADATLGLRYEFR